MRHQIHDLLAPLPGTARQIHSFHFGPPSAKGKIYIQSSLHADEMPGMLVAWHLKQRLAELEAAGRLRSEIVLVPVANPVGLEQVLMDVPLGRYELESGQNFNRWFVDLSEEVGNEIEGLLGDDPQRNLELIRDSLRNALARQTASTQLQSQRLTLQRLACDADMVLDLHCDFEAVAHLYTTPEAWPQVEPLARYIGAEASLLATDSGGQSFDECFTLLWWQLKERFGEHFDIPPGQFFGHRRTARPGRRQSPAGQPRLPGADRLPDSLRRDCRRTGATARTALPGHAAGRRGTGGNTGRRTAGVHGAARGIPGSRATDRRNHRPDQ